MDLKLLNDIVVAAKSATYVGGGVRAGASRAGSHDLAWWQGAWRYLDSYFGGTDFIGQEVVWFEEEPVWAMNYYGHIALPHLIDGQRAGETIKTALSAMYAEGRFLGDFDWVGPHGTYIDRSAGDVGHFHGREVILVGESEAYALDYCGGLVKP